MNWSVTENTTEPGRSPWRVLDPTGQPAAWINEFLDAQALRALSPLTLRMYAFQLLHFARWWSDREPAWSAPGPTAIADYIRFQLSQQPPPAAVTINARLELVRRLCHFHFGPQGSGEDSRLRRRYWRRIESNFGGPRAAQSNLRLREPRPVIVPLPAEDVARFWASFHRCRDLALVALLLLHGLRSREVLSLRIADIWFSQAQIRVQGKGRRQRILPAHPKTLRLLDVYLRSERPATASPFVFVALQGKTRGLPMTPAGLRSLFRSHRRSSQVPNANPHRFRHTFGADMVRAGVSIPALMHLLGHTHVHTTMRYVSLSLADVWREFERAAGSMLAAVREPS
ncbi:MAG: site-specific integrase [Burkholderiales bacterium]|nr:site-specific integrase [Burkholderiales bacterium]